MRKLKLKDSVLKAIEEGQQIRKFVTGKGMTTLNINLLDPRADYDKLQKQGWRLFECKDCGKEFCNGSCPSKNTIEEEYDFDLYEDKLKEIEEYTDLLNEENETEFENLNLKDLRLLYPHIKARSKKQFIMQIENERSQQQ